MKQVLGYSLATVLFVAALLGLTWALEGNDFFLYKYFAPKREAVRRKVFEETQSYLHGKIQNLSQECFAYHKADGAQKEGFAGEIRNEASTVDVGKLPTDEQACVAEARGQ